MTSSGLLCVCVIVCTCRETGRWYTVLWRQSPVFKLINRCRPRTRVPSPTGGRTSVSRWRRRWRLAMATWRHRLKPSGDWQPITATFNTTRFVSNCIVKFLSLVPLFQFIAHSRFRSVACQSSHGFPRGKIAERWRTFLQTINIRHLVCLQYSHALFCFCFLLTNVWLVYINKFIN